MLDNTKSMKFGNWLPSSYGFLFQIFWLCCKSGVSRLVGLSSRRNQPFASELPRKPQNVELAGVLCSAASNLKPNTNPEFKHCSNEMPLILHLKLPHRNQPTA